MEKRTARNWYWWLWLSPLLTVPSLIFLGIQVIWTYDLGYELICRGDWSNCNYAMAERVNILIPVLGSALWHLILLFPALNKKNEYVRWHGRQALLLAGARTAVPSAFVLAFGFGDGILLFIPITGAIWFFGTLWGQRQAARGDCSIARWFGRTEALPRPEPTEYAELDPEALVEIIRHSRDPEERRQALVELEKRGMVDAL